MRLTTPNRTLPAICLVVYGCGQLERVAEFISALPADYREEGVRFTAGQIAGQYAFEQVKLDRKGYDTRRLLRCLSILNNAGAVFPTDEALAHADDLINNFTADFGHDEDGEATFRIKAQSYRLKKYDCHALWARIRQADLLVDSVSREKLFDAEESDDLSFMDDSLDFRLTAHLVDPQGEKFASVQQYFTVTDGRLSVEDLIDYDFTDYPNFHDESGNTYRLIELLTEKFIDRSVGAVKNFLASQNMTLPSEVQKRETIPEYVYSVSPYSFNQ